MHETMCTCQLSAFLFPSISEMLVGVKLLQWKLWQHALNNRITSKEDGGKDSERLVEANSGQAIHETRINKPEA